MVRGVCITSDPRRYDQPKEARLGYNLAGGIDLDRGLQSRPVTRYNLLPPKCQPIMRQAQLFWGT
jgi:hypothetical protein